MPGRLKLNPLFGAAILLAGVTIPAKAGNVAQFMNKSGSNWTLTVVPANKRPAGCSPEVGRLKITDPNSKPTPNAVTVLGVSSADSHTNATSFVLKTGTTYPVEYSRDGKALFHLFNLTSDTNLNGAGNTITVITRSGLWDALKSGPYQTPPPDMEGAGFIAIAATDTEIKTDHMDYYLRLDSPEDGGLTLKGDDEHRISLNPMLENRTDDYVYLSIGEPGAGEVDSGSISVTLPDVSGPTLLKMKDPVKVPDDCYCHLAFEVGNKNTFNKTILVSKDPKTNTLGYKWNIKYDNTNGKWTTKSLETPPVPYCNKDFNFASMNDLIIFKNNQIPANSQLQW